MLDINRFSPSFNSEELAILGAVPADVRDSIVNELETARTSKLKNPSPICLCALVLKYKLNGAVFQELWKKARCESETSKGKRADKDFKSRMDSIWLVSMGMAREEMERQPPPEAQPEGSPGNGTQEPQERPQAAKEEQPEQGKPEQPQPLPKLRTVTAASLLLRPAPARQWLVPDWIPAYDVSLLGGDGGIGKSILVMQLLWAAAAGREWLGMKVKQGPVLYVSCEDAIDEIHFRLEQFDKAECTADVNNFHIFDATLESPLLAKPYRDEDGVELLQTDFFRQVDEKIEELGAVAVAFDASADVFGGNEIDRSQVRGFVSDLRRMSIRRHCASLLLAHPSVDAMKTGRGYSGTTAWNNSMRARMNFTTVTKGDGEEIDQDLRKLELSKTNRGRPGVSKLLRWQAGRFVAESRAFDDIVKRVEDENLFMKLLDQYTREGRSVCVTAGRSYAPKEFAEHPEGKKAKVSIARLKDAMNVLLGVGKITNAEYRVDGKTRYRIIKI